MSNPDPQGPLTLAARLSDDVLLRAMVAFQNQPRHGSHAEQEAAAYAAMRAVLVAALTPEPVTPHDDATLIRAALAGDYADTGTTLPGVSPADRWMDHVTREIGPAQQAWAARAAANRCEAMRRVLAGDPRDPQAIADEIAPRVSWTGVGTP